jgi:hypothetical protein
MSVTISSPRRIGEAPATFLVLMVLTTLSWWVAETGDRAAASGWEHQSVTAIVMTVAAVKLHLIAMRFMELRHAPVILRVVFDAWIVTVCGLVVGLQILLS